MSASPRTTSVRHPNVERFFGRPVALILPKPRFSRRLSRAGQNFVATPARQEEWGGRIRLPFVAAGGLPPRARAAGVLQPAPAHRGGGNHAGGRSLRHAGN